MADKSIVVTIKKNGEVNVEAFEFHGVGCAAIVEAFSSALGSTISSGDKSEIYEEDQCSTVTNLL